MTSFFVVKVLDATTYPSCLNEYLDLTPRNFSELEDPWILVGFISHPLIFKSLTLMNVEKLWLLDH